MHRTSLAQAEAPVFAGDMGYKGLHFAVRFHFAGGDAGSFLPKNVIDAASAEGIALEYYRSYDARAVALDWL